MFLLLFCFMSAAASLVSAQMGLVEVFGAVTDGEGAASADAGVRLLIGDSRAEAVRTKTGQNGKFRFDGVRPGIYTIRAWRRGFREELHSGLEVQRSGMTNAGDLRLDVTSCDGPAVICDDFGLGPPPVSPQMMSV
jgi:Carboxypeptidase regulatory-like domain